MKAEDHMHISEDFISSAGVVTQADCAVTQNGSPNMSVNVASGVVYILNPSWTAASVTETKYWRVKNDATVNVVISANSSGNPRITSIFAKLTTGTTPDDYGTNVASFVAVDGTPAGSPTAPAAPSDGNGYTRLANVTVANGASSIVTGNISDARFRATLDQINNSWQTLGYTFVYGTADDPTYTMTIASTDLTGVIGVGMKARVRQADTYKYFFVTACAFSTNTTVTLYGGTDYDLANATIQEVSISAYKAPVGFPMSKSKWAVVFTDTSNRSQSNPTASTFYNLGSAQISVPIGDWTLSWQGAGQTSDTNSGVADIIMTLSTSSSAETNAKLTAWVYNAFGSGIAANSVLAATKFDIVTTASKTLY